MTGFDQPTIGDNWDKTPCREVLSGFCHLSSRTKPLRFVADWTTTLWVLSFCQYRLKGIFNLIYHIYKFKISIRPKTSGQNRQNRKQSAKGFWRFCPWIPGCTCDFDGIEVRRLALDQGARLFELGNSRAVRRNFLLERKMSEANVKNVTKVVGTLPAPSGLHAELMQGDRPIWQRCCCLLVIEEMTATGAVERRLDAFVANTGELGTGQGSPVSEQEGFRGFVFNPEPPRPSRQLL